MSLVAYLSLFSENFQNLCLQTVSLKHLHTDFRFFWILFLNECFPGFTEKYADFIEANRIEDSMERLKELRRLVNDTFIICILFLSFQ